MNELFPWLIVLLTVAAAYPTVHYLVHRNPQAYNLALAISLTPGFAVGLITLVMFWIALLGRQVTILETLLIYVALMLPGCVWFLRRLFNQSRVWQAPTPDRIAYPLLLIGSAILFNGIQWPFYTQDALGIYATQAHWLYETRGLIPLELTFFSFYQAYPMGVPFTYAFTYMLAGWEHEYLAKGLVTLLGVACIGAVYTLGSAVSSRRVGLIAALLLAFTPSFVRWASSGYVDLPTAYFYTLSVLFCWRMLRHSNWSDAILAGICIGLAAWMKNAALFGIGLYGLWLLYQVLLSRRIEIRYGLLSLLSCCVIALPWYLRNWLNLGILIPATAWTDQAQPTLENVLIFISRPENYAVTGILILIGVVVTLLQFVQRILPSQDAHVLLLFFTLPYFAVWWLLVSYDPRFILLILPILCVVAAFPVETWWAHPSPSSKRRLHIPIMAAIILFTIYQMWIAVDYKQALLANPLMDHAAKLEIIGR
jgi:4-amino-4-deoxy-L-arabinose transferase-like glycosyltransferase